MANTTAVLTECEVERRVMDHSDAQEWLDRYVAAWRSNDPTQIANLFSANVSYRYEPHGQAIEGRDALVRSWLDNPDDPGSWDAHYVAFAVEGNRVVATGVSRYFAREGKPERLFNNCFLIEFDDDKRCRSFTEFYIEEA